MWPFINYKKKVGLSLAKGYKLRFKLVQLSSDIQLETLLHDNYVLGYLFGESSVVIIQQCGPVSGPEYVEIMLYAFEEITDPQTARDIMVQINLNCTTEPSIEFFEGHKMGMDVAGVLIGKKDNETEPHIIEARKMGPELAELTHSTDINRLTNDQAAALYLERKYLSNYIKTKYKII